MIKNCSVVEQNLSDYDDFGVVGKLRMGSFKIGGELKLGSSQFRRQIKILKRSFLSIR